MTRPFYRVWTIQESWLLTPDLLERFLRRESESESWNIMTRPFPRKVRTPNVSNSAFTIHDSYEMRIDLKIKCVNTNPILILRIYYIFIKDTRNNIYLFTTQRFISIKNLWIFPTSRMEHILASRTRFDGFVTPQQNWLKSRRYRYGDQGSESEASEVTFHLKFELHMIPMCLWPLCINIGKCAGHFNPAALPRM